MKSEIFRQKSIDKMSSPEDLNDYVKVTSSGVWIVIVAIILLLIGAIVWGVTSTLSSGVSCAVIIENGTAKCYILEDLCENVKPGMVVKVQGQDYALGAKNPEPVGFNIMDNAYVLHVLDQDDESRVWTYEYNMDMNLEDGMYKGNVALSRISPITFITD